MTYEPLKYPKPGRCACLLPGDEILYCGLPNHNHRFRMCETHAEAYIIRSTERKQSKKGANNKESSVR